MKRASYKFGVAWIALNDDEAETDLETIASQISVVLLADLFEVEAAKVAAHVLKLRRTKCETS